VNSLRELLPFDLWSGLEKKLGREEALRLLWPAIVGGKLAAQTELRKLVGATMIVSVPDVQWQRSMKSFEPMILDAVRRVCGKPMATAVEFMVGPMQPVPRPRSRVTEQRRGPASNVVDLTGIAISDPGVRDAFVRSACKYFARQSEMTK